MVAEGISRLVARYYPLLDEYAFQIKDEMPVRWSYEANVPIPDPPKTR